MGSNLIDRQKFIIGPSAWVSRDWIRKNGLDPKHCIIVTEMNKLRGIDPETMEFILLDGHWVNNVLRHDSDYYFYRHLLSRGAIENRVYGF